MRVRPSIRTWGRQGATVRKGLSMRSIMRRLLPGVALCGALVIAGTAAYQASAQDGLSLSAEIHAGSCFNAKPEIAYDAGDVALVAGSGVRSLPAIATSTVG